MKINIDVVPDADQEHSNEGSRLHGAVIAHKLMKSDIRSFSESDALSDCSVKQRGAGANHDGFLEVQVHSNPMHQKVPRVGVLPTLSLMVPLDDDDDDDVDADDAKQPQFGAKSVSTSTATKSTANSRANQLPRVAASPKKAQLPFQKSVSAPSPTTNKRRVSGVFVAGSADADKAADIEFRQKEQKELAEESETMALADEKSARGVDVKNRNDDWTADTLFACGLKDEAVLVNRLMAKQASLSTALTVADKVELDSMLGGLAARIPPMKALVDAKHPSLSVVAKRTTFTSIFKKKVDNPVQAVKLCEWATTVTGDNGPFMAQHKIFTASAAVHRKKEKSHRDKLGDLDQELIDLKNAAVAAKVTSETLGNVQSAATQGGPAEEVEACAPNRDDLLASGMLKPSFTTNPLLRNARKKASKVVIDSTQTDGQAECAEAPAQAPAPAPSTATARVRASVTRAAAVTSTIDAAKSTASAPKTVVKSVGVAVKRAALGTKNASTAPVIALKASQKGHSAAVAEVVKVGTKRGTSSQQPSVEITEGPVAKVPRK